MSYSLIYKSGYPISCFSHRVAVVVYELEQAVRLTFTGAGGKHRRDEVKKTDKWPRRLSLTSRVGKLLRGRCQ